MIHETLLDLLASIAWPAAIAIAWTVGELAYRWLALPRISSYGIAGFLMTASQGGFLHNPSGTPIALLAHFAFGLILFELGYRINLRWLRVNPWLAITGVVEASGCFAAVFMLAQAFSLPMVPSLLLAALAMATSPAAVLRVANELQSSGQVTERLFHLTACNCLLTLFIFKAVVGYWVLASAGSAFEAVWNTLVVIGVSVAIGATFGVAVPALLRQLGNIDRNATVAFAAAALLLTAVTHAFKFSPLLAALAFGLVARHRRAILSQAQRNFGTLGDLLTVLLFVFITASLDWQQVRNGLTLALAVIAVRLTVKMAATTVFAHLSGVSWRKGALTGLAMTPMSGLVIVLLEQTRHLKLYALDQVAGLAAIVLLLEVIGPVVTRRALVWAGETHQPEGR
ncbi:MAG: sodium:proton antiporter [Candidatus Accumulibacter meliphilus]|uniref:Sodium:proton antiporter n=1 Tax=Candidatus Accumulibacter meliphilus TaxID=2211374 RepID=A0A369XTV8_9PROT|nr:MAG: sodium:proton antiporter [Candidatus Accumulibacter meliphilus]